MELDFEVGQAERHSVVFSFDQFLGRVQVSVDGTVVQKKWALFSLSTRRWYRFSVGAAEPHDVAIEQVRKRWFGGFRAQQLRGFVDGKLVAER
jgi:hypothetical protein